MSQSLKQQVAADALARIVPTLRADTILGIGTGSTANCFIDALGAARLPLKGAVASSEASAARLASWQIPVFDLNTVEQLAYYVDGADEATEQLALVKGGGGALTREKIVAEASAQFICIVDHSKLVPALGRFALPVEVVPMARAHVARRLAQLGGRPVWRDGFVTDNGGVILDVHDLRIEYPADLEAEINQIPGVITNGLFARRPADLLLAAGPTGITAYQRSRT